MKTKPISEIFLEDKNNNTKYKQWSESVDALSSFIFDYEFLKSKNDLTQKEIARRAGTTQSAVSRFTSMKGKPNYDFLRKISEAVGGSLQVTPLGEFTTTLDFNYHDTAKKLADDQGITVEELLAKILNQSFSTFSLEFGQSFMYRRNNGNLKRENGSSSKGISWDSVEFYDCHDMVCGA